MRCAVQVMYILTLGVLQHAQQRGVGSSLLAAMRERAARSGCCSAFLHVIDYNAAAIGFYRKRGFQELALLPQFYYIGCVPPLPFTGKLVTAAGVPASAPAVPAEMRDCAECMGLA